MGCRPPKCRSTPAVLFHTGCTVPPSLDRMLTPVIWGCRWQERIGLYGTWVPSRLAMCTRLLACSERLQSSQSSQCHSQFTPPAALSKFLQKQPGESNARSGECSHLNKKEPFSARFPNIDHLAACQREVLPFPSHLMQCTTASKHAADVNLFY